MARRRNIADRRVGPARPGPLVTPDARRGSRRTELAWGALVACAIATLVLWRTATRTTVRAGEFFGHGHLPYEDITRTTDPWRFASAAGVLVLGVAAWGILRTTADRRRKLVYGGVAGVAVVATVLVTHTVVAASQRRHFDSHEFYADVKAVAAAMARKDIPCSKLTESSTVASRYFAVAANCAISAELAINDGFDDATIRVWVDEDARERWLEATNPEDVNAVVGPTWMVQCEFEATCWEIADKIGGLTE
jgi:hypothetical protein